MVKPFLVAGQTIQPGEFKEININIARLPSRTQIDTPIFVYRGLEEGPVLALTAGMHGDEINGMEIVRRIIENGHHRVARGTVVCMPVINVYGFLNYSRDVPDGKDINRSFPGGKNGSLASRVAWHLVKEILPVIDCGIDFHTGGAMRANYPQVRCMLRDKRNAELAEAFHAPFTIDAPFRPHSLRQTAAQKGKNIIVYEGGESLRLDQHAIDEGIKGTLRIMKFLGMTDDAPAPSTKTKMIWNATWLRAQTAGLFQTPITCGQWIEKDQLAGNIMDPFGGHKEKIMAPASGYVVALNNNPVVNAGDALMNIGMDNFCRIGGENDL